MGGRRRVIIAASAGRSRFGRATFRTLVFAGVGFLLLIPVSAVLFYVFEHGKNDNVSNIGSALKWSLLALLQDQAPYDAQTAGGTVLTYLVLAGGLVLIAVGITAVAARLVELVTRSERGKVKGSVKDHIVICGWSTKGIEILRELGAKEVEDPRPIVILADLDHPPVDDLRITFIKGVPANEDDLRRAGIERADTAIVLADDSNPTATADEIDGRSLITALTIESIRPEVYTCVEVLRAENRRHFERTNADELVVSAEMTGSLLAASAVTHGLSRVVADLITHPVGNEFYSVTAPRSFDGKTFGDASVDLKRAHDCILVAVGGGDEAFEINPSVDRVLREGERLLVVARGPISIAS